MEGATYSYYLIIIGIIAIAVEILLGAALGFELLVLGVIAIISGALGMYSASFQVSMITFTTLILIYIIIGRRYIKSKLAIDTHTTNIDNLIEKEGVVIKKITKTTPGQIKIDGEIWRASAASSIDVGKHVLIKSVSGVTLAVKLNTKRKK